MSFPALEALDGFRHCFTLRRDDIDVNAERAAVIERLWAWHGDCALALGFESAALRTAEQVHGTRITIVGSGSSTGPAAQADGLLCKQPGVVLGIYVADCCAVYLADPRTGAFGIVHSGKKGTEGGITRSAVVQMRSRFGCRPGDIVVQLSPCIRPPAYEVDFAAAIRQQALDAGIRPENLHDTGICTSSDLNRFYSYRMEKGRTGRMLALLGRPR